MNLKKKFLLLISATLLTGCLASGVVYTDDPKEMVAEADYMLRNDRAVGAKNLLERAIKVAQEQQDYEALAQAYYSYGNVIRTGYSSPDDDPTLTLRDSIEYYNKSLKLAKQYDMPQIETTNYYTMGQAYQGIFQRIENEQAKEYACISFKKSMSYNEIARKRGFGIPIYTGHASFEELVSEHMSYLNCN